MGYVKNLLLEHGLCSYDDAVLFYGRVLRGEIPIDDTNRKLVELIRVSVGDNDSSRTTAASDNGGSVH